MPTEDKIEQANKIVKQMNILLEKINSISTDLGIGIDCGKIILLVETNNTDGE